MRLTAIFLGKVFLGLLLCLCSGAPHKKGAPRHIAYSPEEDKFIIQELSNSPSDYIPIHGTRVWGDLSEKFNEQWALHSPGFPTHRSAGSIRARFVKMILKNPDRRAELPETLLRKLRKSNKIKNLKRELCLTRKVYSPEEHNLIIQELSKQPDEDIYDWSIWEAIQKEHQKRLQSKEHGFEFERSSDRMRTHFLTSMRIRGLVPQEIRNKFKRKSSKEDTRASNLTASTSTQPAPQNKPTDRQDTDEECSDDVWVSNVNELLAASEILAEEEEYEDDDDDECKDDDE